MADGRRQLHWQVPRKLERLVYRVEALVKGLLFDCRSCGQCLLSETGLICPMTCPKGLRNGPCGGTVNGECEVYPDRPCVWVRIHQRTAGKSLDTPRLNAGIDASLRFTSSTINHLTGRDGAAREPVAPLALGRDRRQAPPRTASRLERALKTGRFVHTTEVRAPRGRGLDHMRTEAELLRGHFDAVNATAYLSGKPALPSSQTAAELKRLWLEPIAQATCRDHTRTAFIGELITNQVNGVHNMLCLTGDAYKGHPQPGQIFDMDAALMLYEARFLQEHSRVHFSGDGMKDPPRPFLGAAINPFTLPTGVPIRRLRQKIAAGADFVQTQLIFDLDRFRAFMDLFRQEELDRELFLLAGVPVVTSRKALDALPKVPGLHLPAAVARSLRASARSLRASADIRAAGIAFARNMIAVLRELPGVSGVHLMLMGPDSSVLPEVIQPWSDRVDRNPGSTNEAAAHAQKEDAA